MPEPGANAEIEMVQTERTASFRREHEREALSTQWNFTAVGHEQRHEFAASVAGETVGVLGLRIAASLGHIDSLIVAPAARRQGIGRRLLERAEQAANYYNCHKATLEAPAGLPAQLFFEACGYKVEAILRQHTWKLDVALMRKFLL
ncbi:MAG: GNAT family N-acetyltransferase [Candidatus Eremiobacteraeota bacterium]|nr:GNAT family N-acetyltransferase [Candidatus Eremiobacteraeota bacterium]